MGPGERRAHPAVPTVLDEKQQTIIRLIDGLGADPIASAHLKLEFLQFAREEEDKFQVMAGLYHKARRDPLTQLPRPSDLADRLAERLEIETAPNVFALVYFDAKNFKQINDRISHRMGDEVIVQIAKVLIKEMREQDVKVRLGGDEFGGGIFLDIDEKATLGSRDETILSIVERCCVSFEQIAWAEKYGEWKEALKRQRRRIAAVKPALNPGIVIVHAGDMPRIKSNSSRTVFQEILKMAERMMYKSKRYEKRYRHRRIFYRVVTFENQRLKLLAHKFYDSPTVTKPLQAR